MHKYLVKRIIMMLPTLVGAGIFIFFLLRLMLQDEHSSGVIGEEW